MKNKLKLLIIFSLVITLFILLNINQLAASDSSSTELSNISIEDQASLCINNSEIIIQEMIQEGFNIQRLNDTLKQARLLFDSQSILKEQKRTTDFSRVIPLCSEIEALQVLALRAREDFSVLLKVYNDNIDANMIGPEIDELNNMVSEIQSEILSERYEKVEPLVNSAYDKISEIKSSNTGVNVFYSNTIGGIGSLLKAKNPILQIENYWVIGGFIFLLVFFLLIYKTSIRKWRIRNNIDSLRMRKKTVRELIMKLQKDYFQYGKIPEGEYNIRTKKFAEIIRDIDRQIPLLQEEIAKIETNKSLK